MFDADSSLSFSFLWRIWPVIISEVYQLAKDYQAAGNKEFQKGSAYVIPVAQKSSTMVKVLMEDCLNIRMVLSMISLHGRSPHAFNLGVLR